MSDALRLAGGHHANASPVSVIIPVFNGERRLPDLLASIRSQDFDQSLLELLVIDDDSTDNTREVAERFGARVLRNGEHQADRGKAIGVRGASHALLLFIDDDNRLPHRRWLARLYRALEECPAAVGAQAAWMSYQRRDSAVNRYCSLFGIGDPMAFYLGRRDHLMRSERRWTLAGTVLRETDDYWLIKLSPDAFPTVGSQGFLTRRDLVERTSYWPYFFHMDSNLQLARQGHDEFVILKDEIVHEYCDSVPRLLAKLRRNMILYLQLARLRSYRWETPRLRLALKTLWMVAIAGPLARAALEFYKVRDPAVWLHPYLCFRVPFMYLHTLLSFRLDALFHRRAAGKSIP